MLNIKILDKHILMEYLKTKFQWLKGSQSYLVIGHVTEYLYE